MNTKEKTKKEKAKAKALKLLEGFIRADVDKFLVAMADKGFTRIIIS